MQDPVADRGQFPTAEWDVRVDLAAAHRIAHAQGFSEGIFNHLTALVPGGKDQFLALPFGLHWAEATASGLLSVGFDGRVLRGQGEVERSCYSIHFPIHQMRPDAPCVFHTHMPFCSALTRLEDPTLQAIGQTEVSFINDVAYDSDYTGFARDPSEGERLGKVLGDKHILFMGNHGVLVLGRSVGEAYDRLYYLERACQAQIYAMWTGQKLKYISEAVTARTSQQFGKVPHYYGRPHYELHFDALKRLLDGPPKTRFDE
jgi:ribulose-5-phosphate 4-epimerase/fuculose-1-phosphate aldolase